ncbi:FAD-dependent oxidoreductase [Arthrobacter sp. CDRTa11]|uniref:FAD-dependent oxidoreductase n=1 Tax=Arthrobacter sp. CDRTa11 TaxID=2651199 RepID=UPI002265E61E|nr:FAD-dependent oxidoreductase [Arthrobacter sp. CDRTa11]
MSQQTDYDVIVVGGGTSGALAAIAAANTGARTLVVEKQGYLGGIISLGMHMLGTLDFEGNWALGGYGRQLLLDLVKDGYATPPVADSMFGGINAQDPEPAKIFLTKMAQDAGVECLFHTIVIGAAVEDGAITSVTVAHKAGTETLTARTFVDCSGDADLVAHAGGAFTYGAGGGEPVAQPVSNIYKVAGVDLERIWDYLEENPDEHATPPGWSGEAYTIDHIRNTPGVHFQGFRALVKKATEAGDLNIPRDELGIYTFPGRQDVGINITRVHGIDGTDPRDVTKAEIETKLQVLESLRFLKKYVPGFENCYLSSVPHQVGIRESRHITTDHTLTREDVLSGRDFPDQVGRGAYPLDIHDVKPGSTVLGQEVEGGGITLMRIAQSYGIPLRSLVPNGLSNVTVGGRCIGADHEAAGSVRGQAVCMVSGHAAGTAAALAAQHGGTITDVPIELIQKTLSSQGAVLKRNERPQL